MLYHVYGLHIESEHRLSELVECRGRRQPDACFRLLQPRQAHTSLPSGLSFSIRMATSLGVDLLVYRNDARHLLRWDGMCDFVLSSTDSSITCAPVEGVPERFWKGILFGPALAYFLHLMETPTLHASAACLPSGAVAFLADPGGGKSTLASALALAGYPLLTDDLLATRFEGGVHHALPGFPWVNMTKGSLGFVQNGSGSSDADAIDDKSRVPVDGNWASFQRSEVPLRGLFLLARGASPDVRATRLPAGEAIGQLMEHINCLPALTVGLKKQSLSFLARLTARVPVYRLSYPSRFDVFPQVIETVSARAAEAESMVANEARGLRIG